MNKKIVAAAVAALLVPVAGVAAETGFDYTYGEFGYTDLDADGAGADGFVMEGSYQFMEQVFGFASYEDLSGDVDLSTLMVGAGYAHPFNDKVDGFAKVAFVSNDAGSTDDTGFGFEFGLRGMVAEKVEVFGSYSMIEIYDDGIDGFKLGGRYWIQDNFGVSLQYNDLDIEGVGADGFTIAGRYNF